MTRIVLRSKTVMTECVVVYTRFEEASKVKVHYLVKPQGQTHTSVIMIHASYIFSSVVHSVFPDNLEFTILG